MFQVARYPRAKPEVNNILARWRAASRTPRFDQSTGQKRKLWSLRDTRGIAALVALALVVGSGLAVVSVSSAAEAHTPRITPSCEGLHVTGQYYETGGANLVTIQIDGGATETFEFGRSFDSNDAKYRDSFTFADSTKQHTYTATVTAYNAKTKSEIAQWNMSKTGISTPCAAPSVDLTAASCEAPGEKTAITATFSKLNTARTYTITLKDAAGNVTEKDETFKSNQDTTKHVFTGTAPGNAYTVTITDNVNTDLTASKTVTGAACPDDAGIAIVPCECTVPGGDASLKVNLSDVIIGHEYNVTVVNAVSGDVVYEKTVTAEKTGGVQVSTRAVAASGSYYATVVDASRQGAEPLKSSTHTFLPCPDMIPAPVVTATQCDAVSTEAQGEISVAANGLVPGRSYNIVVTDGENNPVFTKNGFVADASTFNEKLTGLAEGTYTVTVTDVLKPKYTNSAMATLLPCATNDTTIEFAAEQCTAPGGAAALTATVSHFAVGRDYTVTLMLNNVAVGESQKLDSSTGAAQTFTFADLEPDNTYRVVVTDTKSSPDTITAAQDVRLDACPTNPVVVIAQAECNVLGASSVDVSAEQLVVGQSYTVTVMTKSTGGVVEGVTPVTFEADMPTRSLTIDNVPNGDTYTVTIENADKSLSGQGEVTLEVCDLPTFPLPPEEPPTTVPPVTIPSTVDLPTLAYTGSSTFAPTLAGLGFLQLGLVLVGFSVARRRSVVRDS